MSIHLHIGRFQLFMVLHRVYRINTDSMQERCFRVQYGTWHAGWPKRK